MSKPFQEWKSLPQTEAFFRHLHSLRQQTLEAWADGRFTDASVEGTAQLNAKMLGYVELIDQIINLEEIETHDE